MGNAILILAAGKSSRMGRIKQLLPYKNSTLLKTVIEQALRSEAETVCVVLGYQAELIRKEIGRFPIKLVVNPNYEKGLSSSIAAGVKEHSDHDGIMILLGDQPEVNKDYMNELISSSDANPGKIIASDYKGVKGVPALFPRKYFRELLELEGDKGAKNLLNSEEKPVITVKYDVNLLDIDSPEDYENLKG